MTKVNIRRSPDLLDVYHHMRSLHSRAKLLTFSALALCVLGTALTFLAPDPPVWNLRSVFHIGISANPILVIEGSLTPQGAVEHYSTVVALISDPAFREAVVADSEFQPTSAALSKRLVFGTLRARALNDSDIEIDLSAASAVDCRSAYRAIADRIERRHALMFEHSKKLVRSAINDYRERSIQLRQWEDARLQSASRPSADHAPAVGDSRAGLGVTWNETREHLRRLEAVEAIMTPTTFPTNEIYVNGPLSNNTARLSALVGLAVVLCVALLALGLAMRRPIKWKSET
jgi:hypothetical protein